jgi:hypothetical protein
MRRPHAAGSDSTEPDSGGNQASGSPCAGGRTENEGWEMKSIVIVTAMALVAWLFWFSNADLAFMARGLH